MELVPGEVSFSLDVLRELYQMVSNINVCPMREIDFKALGESGMLTKARATKSQRGDTHHSHRLTPEATQTRQ
jgi:hypothetical protein